MSYKCYANFVRPTSIEERSYRIQKVLTGDEAKKLYLQEVKEVSDPKPSIELTYPSSTIRNDVKLSNSRPETITSQSLFLSIQNNDVDKVKVVLDNYPDKINVLDEFGWSLLMIACQANSIETVKELLKRGIDTDIRDKAGNSARSLVIKNKNITLADILINHSSIQRKEKKKFEINKKKVKLKEEYICDICNKSFLGKDDHLASTIHNINASKGKKVPANFKIPGSNKGYQLMLKDGWDEQSGLGPEGSGKIYPIKTKQKIDRKGLGHKKERRRTEIVEESKKHFNKISARRDCMNHKQMEINFRREFY